MENKTPNIKLHEKHMKSAKNKKKKKMKNLDGAKVWDICAQTDYSSKKEK